jgi:SAM-dependent methyltransferase
MRGILKALERMGVPERQRAKLGHYANKARYFGLKFKCPICGSHLRKLNPFGFNFPVLTEKNVIGGGYRLNAQCPICYSTDRERLLYLYLSNRTGFFSDKAKVLHVAPERALSQIIKANPNIDYLTADISARNVMMKMDITKIDFPDNTFDVIICNHVLEHIIDDRKAMAELLRVLKPGGWGILQVPISLSLEETYEDISITRPADRASAFGQSDHVRIYAMDYVDRLRQTGFEVSKFDWREDQAFCGSSNKYGLLASESVFMVNKAQSMHKGN